MRLVVIQPAEQNTTTTSLTSFVTQTQTHHITSSPAISESSTSVAAPETHTSAPPVHNVPDHAAKPAAPAPKPAPPAEKEAPAVKKPAKQPASHASSPITNTGSHWCMTYSPYTSSGGCKSASAITSDVADIATKGFSSIRLYSTDCSGLSAVSSAASAHGLNLVLGIYISDSGISAAEPQIQEIVSWANGQWSAVEMIVVGNEAVFNNFCTAEALATFVASAKSAFQAAGYTGPVTTTETIETLTENKATLCPVMDVAAANIHPFFNGHVAASQAGQFVASQLQLLEQVCPGKEAYNLETGWPSQGEANGAAIPGTWEQEAAVMGIKQAAGGKSAFFSFENDLWKEEGEFGVERSWGCSKLFN